MQQQIGKSTIEQALSYNRTWTLMPMCAENVDIMEASKAWKSAKAVALNVMVRSLEKCMRDNGHDYAVEVWKNVGRQLMTANFHGKSAPIAIWSAMYRKASLLVTQSSKKPENIGQAVEPVLDDLLARSAKVAKGMTA